jgi:hypothetical protein
MALIEKYELRKFVEDHSAEIPADELEAWVVYNAGFTDPSRRLNISRAEWGDRMRRLRERALGEKPKMWSDKSGFRSKDGFVYFIQSQDGAGPVKIGHAKRPGRRLAGFQCGSPVILRIIGVEPAPPIRERALHEKFAEHRLHNEWFYPAMEVLEYIWETRNQWPMCNTEYIQRDHDEYTGRSG